MLDARADPPVGGDFWILKIANAPSPKNVPKNGLPQKGGSLSVEGVLSALAFDCSHALVAEGFRKPSAAQ